MDILKGMSKDALAVMVQDVEQEMFATESLDRLAELIAQKRAIEAELTS